MGIGKKLNEAKLVAIIHDPSSTFLKAGMPGAPSLPIPQVKDLIAYLHALGTQEENVQPAASMKAATSSGSSVSASRSASNTSASAPPPNGTAHVVPASASVSASSHGRAGNSSLIAQGHQLFQQHTCAACHGSTAQGTPIAPPLAGIGRYLSESTFSSLVHHPNAAMRAKSMPANSFSHKQTHALWAYLNSMNPPRHPAPGVPPAVSFKSGNTAHASAPAHKTVSQHEVAKAATTAPTHHEEQAKAATPAPLAAKPAVKNVAETPSAAPTGNIAAGRALFQQHTCAACHGSTAQGTPIAPPLAGIAHYLSKSTFSLLVHHPNAAMRAKGMPANTFSDQQITNLWVYLNSMQPPAHRAPGVPPAVPFKGGNSAHTSAPAHKTVSQHEVAKASAPASTQPSVQPTTKPTVQQVAVSGPAAAGEQIFDSHGCIACHGEGGVGTPLAISLIGITKTVPHDQLIALIRKPDAKMKAGGMPSFGFNDTQLNDVVAYLETLKKPGAAKAATAVHHRTPHKLTPLELAGRSIYFKQRCSTCHGDGSMEGTAAAPSLTATASELPPAMIEKLLLHPSEAMRSSGMPAIDLTQANMKSLVAFVRSLRYNR